MKQGQENSKISQVSFLLFGIGMLMPWNAMLASLDFFKEEFPSYMPTFSLLSAVSTPMFLFQAINFFFMQGISPYLKVTLMFALSSLITFGIVLATVYIDDESTSYWAVIALCLAFGAAFGVL